MPQFTTMPAKWKSFSGFIFYICHKLLEMRILKFAFAALLTCTLFIGQAFSQNQSPNPCDDPQTQFEMNQCAAEEYKEADLLLNKTYKRLMEVLSEDSKTKVRETQRLWLKYRDSHCNFASEQYEGGSMQPMIHNGCLTDLTKDRTRELQSLLDIFE
jgi:uncharacterized protein YecT (DUF1311 family)